MHIRGLQYINVQRFCTSYYSSDPYRRRNCVNYLDLRNYPISTKNVHVYPIKTLYLAFYILKDGAKGRKDPILIKQKVIRAQIDKINRLESVQTSF